ncbi:MAG: glycosyltransferase family 2 protein [Candidatus Sumerlaeota bacterium]|nr:glycosyltransferase family 2 protein [Candidatus Sumerlaeota bacterium]
MATVSIVIPCYNEEDNIIQIKEAICETLSGMALDLEFIFVDDGSKDKTWEVLSHLSLADSRVKGLKLSRNFGHQSAILAGLHHARGDCVISMDCDLQHPPSVLPEFINKFNFLSDYKIAKNAGDFRLLDRRVLDKILQFHETDLFLRGIVNWMGFNVAHVPYNQPPRLHGDTKYRLGKMLGLALNGIVSFTSRPLYIAFVTGGIFIIFSLIYIIFIIARWLMGFKIILGWTSIIVLILLSTGFQLLNLGVIGVYLASLYKETKSRPRFIIWDSVGLNNENKK